MPSSLLITGGTGTFGRACISHLLKSNTYERICVYSRDEFKQQQMADEFPDDRLRYFIGDVRDLDRLRRAFHGVDTVIHAAALKQVPTCEYNPREAILTNIVGALNVIEAALDCGVRRVMALSTDKAVRPVNLYGATKLCAEKLFVRANAYGAGTPTRFSIVRYGNVLGSRGSLWDRWRNGASRYVLTDPRMTRFGILPGEAVVFVLRCLEEMQGGEIFVPKLPGFHVLDSLRAVTATGSVQVVGIRPGEKLHETLIAPEEQGVVECEDCFIIEPAHPSWTYIPRAETRQLGLDYTSEQAAVIRPLESVGHDFAI